MKIVADCDGVFADFVGGVCKRLSAAGYPRTPDQFNTERIGSSVTAPERKIIEELAEEEGFCSSLKWYPSAPLFLETLRDLGDVVVMTAPWHCRTWAHERREWFRGRLPKDQIWSVPSKGKALAASFADVLIEDKTSTCEEWSQLTGRFSILIDRPWNAGDVTPHGVIRCFGFAQAARAIQFIARDQIRKAS